MVEPARGVAAVKSSYDEIVRKNIALMSAVWSMMMPIYHLTFENRVLHIQI